MIITTGSLKQESILQEAERLVNGPRQGDYGHPYDDYSKVAKIWSGILRDVLKVGYEVTPLQAALCMVGVKLSREANKHKRDNLVDAAGYAQVADMIAARETEINSPKYDPNQGFKNQSISIPCCHPLVVQTETPLHPVQGQHTEVIKTIDATDRFKGYTPQNTGETYERGR